MVKSGSQRGKILDLFGQDFIFRGWDFPVSPYYASNSTATKNDLIDITHEDFYRIYKWNSQENWEVKRDLWKRSSQ
jgi:hypothetical protein